MVIYMCESSKSSKTVKYIDLNFNDLTLYDITRIVYSAEIMVYNGGYDDILLGIVDKDEYKEINNMFLDQKRDLSYDDKYANEYKERFGERCFERYDDVETLVLHYLLNKYDLDTIVEITSFYTTEDGESLTALLDYNDIKYLDLPIKKEEELLVCLDEEKYRDP